MRRLGASSHPILDDPPPSPREAAVLAEPFDAAKQKKNTAREHAMFERYFNAAAETVTMPYNVPSEPLWAIFTPDAIHQLSLVGNPSSDLEFRLQVLAAGGLNSHNRRGQALRAYKAPVRSICVRPFRRSPRCRPTVAAHGSG
jgi:hypothetical protein